MPNMGMGNINNMNMGGMMNSVVGGMGMPGSPRIGGSSTSSGAMGPPGLPRSASNDGMNMNMNMAAGAMNMGGSGLNMMGGMNMNLGNLGGAGNLSGMNIGMNGPTPRPQSSMGISGGVGGMVSSGIGGAMGLPGHNVSNMGMNMMTGINVDSPSRSAPTSQGMGGQTLGAGPHTPMRQGSLPPQNPSSSQLQQSHSGMGSINMSTLGGVPSIRQNPIGNASNLSGGPGLAGQSGPVSRRQSVPLAGIGGNIHSNLGIGGNIGGTSHIAPAPLSPMSVADTGIGMPAQHQQQSLTGVNTTMLTTHTATMAPGITNPASSSPTNSSAPVASPSATVSGPSTNQSMSASNHSQFPALNPSTTLITNVPLLNSEQHIRPLSPTEIENIKKWMDVDREYERRMRAMKGQMNEELRDTFKPALSTQGLQFPDRWLSTAAPHWWERGGWGSTGSNWSRFRKPGREMFDVKYSGKRDAASRSGYKSSRKGVRREGFKL